MTPSTCMVPPSQRCKLAENSQMRGKAIQARNKAMASKKPRHQRPHGKGNNSATKQAGTLKMAKRQAIKRNETLTHQQLTGQGFC